MSDFDTMMDMAKDANAGMVKAVYRKKDGTPILAQIAYFECPDLEAFLEDLEKLEEKHGFGQ